MRLIERNNAYCLTPHDHRAVRDGDDDALPNAATGCEAQAMEEHAAEDIKHIPPTTVRLPAARSLPLGLADGGHAALRGRAGRTLTWSSAGSTARSTWQST